MVTKLSIESYHAPEYVEPELLADLDRLGWFERGAAISLNGGELRLGPPAPDRADMIWIEHTGKPEWGRGKIVREFDGKLEIAFPSGSRTLKADAPFLKRSH